MFDSIISSELDLLANEYIKDVLRVRWEQISNLNDPNVLNRSGSYVYIRSPLTNGTSIILGKTDKVGSTGNCLTIFGNESNGVIAMNTRFGARINLLCTNYEFEALMSRWTRSMGITR